MKSCWSLSCVICCLFLLLACREQSKEDLLQQGREFVKAGNQQAAITLFKNALEQDPNYLDARLQLGLAYYELGKLDFAEKELEKAQRQDRSNRDITLHLAQIYLKTDRLDKAQSELSRLENAAPQDAAVLAALGECYALNGDHAKAEEKFRKALQYEPANLEAQLGLVQVHFALQRYAPAAELLQKVIADNPGKTTPSYLQYRLAMQQADRVAALAALQRVRTIDGKDLEAAYLLALLQFDGGNIDAARKIAEEIKATYPDHPLVLRIEGLADLFQGKYEQSLNPLQKSLASMQDVGGYYFVGLNLFQLKNYEQALSSFQKAIELAPNYEPPRLMLAQTFLMQNRVDDCVRTAQAILAQNSRSAMAHNMLASAYLAQGKYDQAMSHLDQAIEIQPDLPEAHVKKGLFNLALGDVKKGELALQSAVAVAPDSPNARLLLANHYLRTRNYPLAIKTLQEGISTSPDSAILYNLMAAAYLAQSKDSEAISSLQKAKSLKPDYLAPYFNLTGYYVNRLDYPAAIKEAQQAVKAVPRSLRAITNLAGLYELTGDREQALLYYKQAGSTGEPAGYIAYAAYLFRIGQKDNSVEVLKSGYAAHPDNPDLTKALGVAYKVNGQPDEAIKLFVKLEQLAPGSGLPLLIAVHLQKGDVTAANEIASRAINEQPQAEYGYQLQAGIYEQRKEWSAAEEILKRGIAACKQNVALKMSLARIYTAQMKTQQALQIYDELLLSQPKFAPALFAKGAVYDTQGNKGKAQELYEATIKLDDTYAPALNNLAYLHMATTGNHKVALQLAIRAFRKMPEDPSVIDTLGYALLKNGQPDKAVAFLEKAARLRPNEPAIQSHLEEARKNAGKKAG